MNEEDDKASFFVSRRGRQVGVHEVDMKGIDIESNADTQMSAQKETKATTHTTNQKQPVVELKRDRSAWTKRKRLIVLAVVFAVLLAPILVAELVTAQYSSATSGAKSDMDTLVNSTVLPAQKKSTISSDDIRKIAGNVNETSSQMCRGGLVDNMAKLYPRAKSAYDNCKQTQNDYVTLTNNLYVLEAQARYLEKVDVVIRPVAEAITDEYAVIGAQQTAWLKASEDLKKLNPPGEFKTAHTDLMTHLGAVADNWSKLNIANNGQDSAGFREAEKTLNMEYEAVRSSSGEFVTILSMTQTKVLNAYLATK